MNGKTMTTPEQPNPWYILLTNVLPWATLYGLTHTAIYYVFKYWTDSRDEAIKRIVEDKFDEKLKPLETKIEHLTTLWIQHNKK